MIGLAILVLTFCCTWAVSNIWVALLLTFGMKDFIGMFAGKR